jgi:hypothetical protein
MENLHHTQRAVSLDWLRDVQSSLRTGRRSGVRPAALRQRPHWGSRLVNVL